MSRAKGPELPDPDRPLENYFVKKWDEDPLPDPNLLDVDEPTRQSSEKGNIEDMTERAIRNGLPKD